MNNGSAAMNGAKALTASKTDLPAKCTRKPSQSAVFGGRKPLRLKNHATCTDTYDTLHRSAPNVSRANNISLSLSLVSHRSLVRSHAPAQSSDCGRSSLADDRANDAPSDDSVLLFSMASLVKSTHLNTEHGNRLLFAWLLEWGETKIYYLWGFCCLFIVYTSETERNKCASSSW